jgi:capsid protein
MDVVGYYVRDSHPGDDKKFEDRWTYFPAFYANGLPRLIHHFERGDEGQHRGLPRCQVGIKRLKNAEEYDEAELERNYVGACLAAIVRTDMPTDEAMAGHGVVENADGTRQRDITPGMFHYVGESDMVETTNPSGAPQSFGEYMEYEGRMFAAGAGTPYEMLTGNWRNLAYNAARIIWNMDEAVVDVTQKGHAKTWLAIYCHFVSRMVVSGQIDIDQVAYRSQPWLYSAARVIAPSRASLDPAREDRNELVLIESRVKPHSEMVERKTGQPASAMYRRIARNLDELEEWGLERHLPNMGRDADGMSGANSSTMPGDSNQESSDANSEETESSPAD